MTEKFNMDYRHFAKAAKEAAPEKRKKGGRGLANPIHRKDIGRDPDILRKKGSQELQDNIPVGALLSFLKTLGGSKDTDARHILGIGNFLYRHRTELENKDKVPNRLLLPEDRRLMDLACTLVENAFYRGDFLQVPKEQRAALAFTMNVIAKIFKNPKSCEGLKGFDSGKFGRFIDAVHDFEQQSLFPGIVAKKGANSACEQALSILQDEIDEKKKRAGAVNSDIKALVQRRNSLKRTDGYFIASELRDRGLMSRQYMLPYIFKYVLIVRDRTESVTNEKERTILEENISIRRFPSDWEKEIKKYKNIKRDIGEVGRHFMIPADRGTDASPFVNKYSDMHFISEDIPFAVWALRYLRSQKTLSDKKSE